MNRCETFTKTLCRQMGLDYAEMRQKYWSSHRGQVWLPDGGEKSGYHCVHCARADAISENEDKEEQT